MRTMVDTAELDCTVIWRIGQAIELTHRGTESSVEMGTRRRWVCPSCETWFRTRREAVEHLRDARYGK